jgi:hypothetical protein
MANALIRNGTDWLDTQGRPIVAHDGGITRVGDAYYWYGTSYEGNPTGKFGLLAPFAGFNVYRSSDLVHWEYRGQALSRPPRGWLTVCSSHRAHVLFNEGTGKFVLWFTWHPKHPAAFLMVAVSDTPEGPFELLGPRQTGGPWGNGGDVNVFQDDDGVAYVLYDDGEFNMRIDRLTDDYTASTGESALAVPRMIEAATMARVGGRYLVAGSGVYGWNPTETQYATADSPLGPYTPPRTMSSELTWGGQICDLVRVGASSRLMAMCDQWWIPDRQDLNRSRYLWLPVECDAAGETGRMVYAESWNPMEASFTPGS